MVEIARIQDGVVVERVSLSEGLRLEDAFHPGLGFIECPSSVGTGWSYAKGVFSPPEAAPFDLEPAKNSARVMVNALAETARLAYLTPGMGQSLTYQAKAEEIRRYDADTNPVKADYPFLSSEIGVTGDSLAAVADVVRAAVALWTEKGSEIERVRLKAQSDVSKADSSGKLDAIVNALEWP